MRLLKMFNAVREQNALTWIQLIVLLLFFASLSFGQLGRVLEPTPFYIHDVLVVAWLLLTTKSWCRHLFTIFTSANLKRWWPLHTFGAWLLIGMLLAYPNTRDLTPWLYLGRVTLYVLFLFSLKLIFEKTATILKLFLSCTGLYMAWYGLAQYILLPDSRYLAAFGWDDHYFRLIGPLLDPNLSGMLYIIFAWVLFSLRTHIPQRIWAGGVGFCMLAIVLTYSRASYLAAIVSLLFYWFHSRKKLNPFKSVGTLLIVVVGSVMVYLVAPKPGGEGVDLFRTTSIMARIETTTRHITTLQGYQWLTGSGFYSQLPGNSPLTHARVPDNFLILILASTGAVGAALFVASLVKLFPQLRQWQPEILAAFIALAVHTQFNNSALEPFIFLSMGIAIISQFSQRPIREKS